MAQLSPQRETSLLVLAYWASKLLVLATCLVIIYPCWSILWRMSLLLSISLIINLWASIRSCWSLLFFKVCRPSTLHLSLYLAPLIPVTILTSWSPGLYGDQASDANSRCGRTVLDTHCDKCVPISVMKCFLRWMSSAVFLVATQWHWVLGFRFLVTD